METRKSKYDTNPLDPDVERKAEEAWGNEGAGGGETRQVGGETRQVFMDGALADHSAARDLPLTELVVETEAKDFADLPHGHSLSAHVPQIVGNAPLGWCPAPLTPQPVNSIPGFRSPFLRLPITDRFPRRNRDRFPPGILIELAQEH